jgi:Ca2+-dependent lipid-binding protein
VSRQSRDYARFDAGDCDRSIDPYVEVRLGAAVVHKTKVLKNTRDPKWHERADFVVKESQTRW